MGSLACAVQEQIREVVGLRDQLAQSEQALDEARKASTKLTLLSCLPPAVEHWI